VSAEAGPILPTITDLNKPFWDACAVGELRMQACAQCGHVRYPVAPICPQCLSPQYEWRRLSGRGEILSWVYFQRAYHAAWENRVPYNVILVQLEEGPRMFSNALPLGRDDLRIGMRVQVEFDDESGVALPRFCPVVDGQHDS
jgi:uncharacterized OB-fold protein